MSSNKVVEEGFLGHLLAMSTCVLSCKSVQGTAADVGIGLVTSALKSSLFPSFLSFPFPRSASGLRDKRRRGGRL